MYKPIPTLEDRYEVNELGEIKSVGRYINNGSKKVYLKPKTVKQKTDTMGNFVVLKTPEGKNVYTRTKDVVYKTFIGDIPEGMFVVFCDGDIYNSALSNLKLSEDVFEAKRSTGKNLGFMTSKRLLNWLVSRNYFLTVYKFSENKKGFIHFQDQIDTIKSLFAEFDVEVVSYKDYYSVYHKDMELISVGDVLQISLEDFVKIVLSSIICHLGLDDEEVRFRNVQGNIRITRELPEFEEA